MGYLPYQLVIRGISSIHHISAFFADVCGFPTKINANGYSN